MYEDKHLKNPCFLRQILRSRVFDKPALIQCITFDPKGAFIGKFKVTTIFDSLCNSIVMTLTRTYFDK